MVRNSILKFLAAPIAALFGLIVEARLLLYKIGILKRSEFSLPTVGVGNLSVGGAGKTPHTEYLLKFLHEYINVGSLSRGYGRKTSGFRWVKSDSTALEVGDESLQIKRKFEDIPVVVSEDRIAGVSQLLQRSPKTQAIILDDAYQNLAVKLGVNLLLTEFDRPFWTDYLMPVGRLREWRSGAERADAIIVTKCPDTLSADKMKSIINEIDPHPHQKVFFSKYTYAKPWLFTDPRFTTTLEKDWEVVLITAIARVDYLKQYLKSKVSKVHELSFGDHHVFKEHELGRLARLFEEIKSEKKIIITTEKDAMRLYQHATFLEQKNLPIFALPAQVEFFEPLEGETFNQYILNKLLDFRS